MMSTETTIKKSVVVDAPVAHCFKVFTERFDTWWPRSHHIGKVEPYTAIVEPREGGRWFERGADGSECEWGRVLVYDSPLRITVSWHLGIDFKYDADPAKASRVEVTFHDAGHGKTRVELVHSQLDRHGAGWEKVREGVSGTGGWSTIMDGYAKALISPSGAEASPLSSA